MALAVKINFTFVDDDGDSAITSLYVPTGFSFAQYVEFMQSAGQLLADCSVGTLTRISASVELDLAGATLKASASVGAATFRKAQIIFNSAVVGFRKLLRLPTYTEVFTPVGSDDLDQADPAVAAFLAAHTNGIAVTGGTMQPTDIYGQDLVGVREASEFFLTT